MSRLIHILSIIGILALISCKPEPPELPVNDFFQLISVHVGSVQLKTGEITELAPVNQPIVARFGRALDRNSVTENLLILNENQQQLAFEVSYLDNDKTVSIRLDMDLEENHQYSLQLKEGIRSTNGKSFPGETFEFRTLISPLLLNAISLNGVRLDTTGKITDIAPPINLELHFSQEVEVSQLEQFLSVRRFGETLNLDIQAINGDKQQFLVTTNDPLKHLSLYFVRINQSLTTSENHPFAGFEKRFYTQLDTTPKMPVISDEDLLTEVQRQTFKYFWDFAHPVSGLNRERNTSNDLVTSGGSGFGVMAIIVGIERGFITRSEGVDRLEKIVNFLGQADRFHGVWSHWLSGSDGRVIPFSSNDDGGDLVETSYMIMGLLTARQYLDEMQAQEAAIQEKIDSLWHQVEWDWYTQGGQNALFWHWSPNFEWEKNHRISGYNEALITYILAAASPSHTIDASVYHQGWARNGNMVNDKDYYGYKLPLGPNLGGPLFFEQYTFLGIDPRNLTDNYANYWEQVQHHSLINYEYCIDNPNRYVGYSDACWGLTASDGNNGYSAHSPTNDRGVITPTAALSSMPFTPQESMRALKHFYYQLGDRLWGEYGFYDAFNITEGWTASSFLAIDQGPIICMIENHRTGLLWNLFMSCPEVQTGLTKLGFTY